ncbi:phosphoinositide phospholipase C 2-like isoform X2 [Momordica charantia]|uniref:Phosphoinositide phospholipase C n=1 Tax=Momordica charantia TaxID=3673 RepID=A0A6J1DD40_MOMCH|nr:phosphoinositide phospholipase C 2-like isoform X2 [Momordica charantia]
MYKQSFRVCFCFRRRFRTNVAEAPEDVEMMFRKYSENGIMNIDHLQRFLEEIQGESSDTKAQAIFNNLKHLGIFQRRGLRLEDFFRYLFGDLNLAFSPSQGVYQDMGAPLSHYYIFTGHNSYLTGNQLSSDSSVTPIIRALNRGVRAIELDLWPNSKKNDIDVLHGGTLTAPVKLIKCLRAIKDHAFTASEYPLVITFEDHLTPDLRKEVARMVTATFGDMLYVPRSEYLNGFPSPESLRRRILISTKPPEHTKGESIKEKPSADKQRDTADDDIWESVQQQQDMDEDHLEEEEEEDKDENNAVPEYRSLIAIHAGKMKSGSSLKALFNDIEKVSRLSLSEQELENAIRKHGRDIIRFTRRNLLRVYPKGLRLDSSNYNPMLGWTHGAQMVAFNMQGYGKYLWIMEGMFRGNGGCGYIKKPDVLLKNLDDPASYSESTSSAIISRLKVKVYMGEGWHLEFGLSHFDFYSPPDLYVKVGIVGVRKDTETRKTSAIEDEWIPVWNEEFCFSISAPELALLNVVVRDYDTSGKDDFAGQTCLPVTELRSGIRSVPLYSRKGEKFKHVKLLMRFEFE